MCARESNHSPLATRHLPLKLGLLGGSFNPIHNGHLTVARLVRDRLRLDQVLFIPTSDPPHKQGGSLASSKDRYEMVRLALAGTPSFQHSDIELQRSGKSYSIDTIRELQRQFGSSTELYFLIGLDAFLDLPHWKEPLELLRACRFVVVPRPGQSFRSLAHMPLLPALDTHALMQLDAGTLPQLDIAMPSCRGIICLPIPPCSISASEIRQQIRRRTAQANMLPPPVESYILQHRLYQEDCDRTNI